VTCRLHSQRVDRAIDSRPKYFGLDLSTASFTESTRNARFFRQRSQCDFRIRSQCLQIWKTSKVDAACCVRLSVRTSSGSRAASWLFQPWMLVEDRGVAIFSTTRFRSSQMSYLIRALANALSDSCTTTRSGFILFLARYLWRIRFQTKAKCRLCHVLCTPEQLRVA